MRVDNGNPYKMGGYMLVRSSAGRFAFQDIHHCSCASTDYPHEDDCQLALDEVFALARSQGDPRVPDVKTTSPFLLQLYDLLLEYEDEIREDPARFCRSELLGD